MNNLLPTLIAVFYNLNLLYNIFFENNMICGYLLRKDSLFKHRI